MTDTYEAWIGRRAIDRDGAKIGSISDIYYDDVTGQPEWVTVRTGFLGQRSSFVPVHGADVDGDSLRLPFYRDRVREAPRLDTDGRLTPDEERALYAYYSRDEELVLDLAAERESELAA